MKVYLGPADRKRYDLADDAVLDVDLSIVMQHEAEELDEFGIDPDDWPAFINSGEVRVWRAVVWLALVRNGVDVKLADVRFNRRSVRYEATPSPGKDDESPSETSESPTPPPSSQDTESP